MTTPGFEEGSRTAHEWLRQERARQIVQRYTEQLRAVIAERLNRDLLRREGVSDVLQSAFASFFRARPDVLGRPGAADDQDVVGLLVVIAVRKALNAVRRHHSGKRDQRRELPAGEDADFPGWALDQMLHGPSPAAGVAAPEAADQLLGLLADDERRIANALVEGRGQEEIARELDTTTRTVQRKVARIRGKWRAFLSDEQASTPEDDRT
jgi:RNA polymerase sigma factor (sigma-70 family)